MMIRIIRFTTFTSIASSLILVCNGWLVVVPLSLSSIHHNGIITQERRSTCLYGTSNSAVTESNKYQEEGNKLIYDAALTCCGVSKDQLDIQWKSGKIIITVKAENTYMSNPDDNIDEELFWEEDGDDNEMFEEDDDEEIFVIPQVQQQQQGVDVTMIARAIHDALDNDKMIGTIITETYEIEVTTPGASDELLGDIMFQAYKGFDVIVEFIDTNKKKDNNNKTKKTIEGKLVERNEECTIINIKGRMKKINNEDVLSVKLPKAKKEKGVR